MFEQESELVMRKEDHLDGLISAQPVAITRVSRDTPFSHCAIQGTSEEAVFVGSGLRGPG